MDDRIIPVDHPDFGIDVGLDRARDIAPNQIPLVIGRQRVGGRDRMSERKDQRNGQRNQAQKCGQRNPAGSQLGGDLSFWIEVPGRQFTMALKLRAPCQQMVSAKT